MNRSVYIVDDDSMVRRSLGFALGTAGFQAHPFASGRDFLDAVDMLSSGCVALDIRMPDMDGLEVLEELGERRNRFPVIAMTGHGDIETAVRAMKLGASDFLEKPFPDEALQEILERLFAALPAVSHLEAARADAKRKIGALTNREMDVLRGIVAGLPNKALAHKLGLSVRTVEMHRSNLLTRLGTPSTAAVVRLAFLAGVESV